MRFYWKKRWATLKLSPPTALLLKLYFKYILLEILRTVSSLLPGKSSTLDTLRTHYLQKQSKKSLLLEYSGSSSVQKNIQLGNSLLKKSLFLGFYAPPKKGLKEAFSIGLKENNIDLCQPYLNYLFKKEHYQSSTQTLNIFALFLETLKLWGIGNLTQGYTQYITLLYHSGKIEEALALIEEVSHEIYIKPFT